MPPVTKAPATTVRQGRRDEQRAQQDEVEGVAEAVSGHQEIAEGGLPAELEAGRIEQHQRADRGERDASDAPRRQALGSQERGGGDGEDRNRRHQDGGVGGGGEAQADEVEHLVGEDSEQSEQGERGPIAARREHPVVAPGHDGEERRGDQHPAAGEGERRDLRQHHLADDVQGGEDHLHDEERHEGGAIGGGSGRRVAGRGHRRILAGVGGARARRRGSLRRDVGESGEPRIGGRTGSR